MLNKLYAVLCTVSGVLAFWLGGIDSIITCLTAMMIIDYITGVLQAVINKNLNSEIGFKGIAKKVTILLIVALSFIIETATNGMFPIREIVIMFFIANEALSLLENAAKMGVPFPDKLIEILEQLKKKRSDDNDEK